MTAPQIVFDATHLKVAFIPRTLPPFAVAGYINGAVTGYIWTDADWALFPGSFHIRINVTGDPTRGNALDVENGDATPADVQRWIETRGPQLAHPSSPLLVYCNRSNVAACEAARNAAEAATGIHAFIWESTLDGTITGAPITQFGQITSGGVAVADISLITSAALITAMGG